jgi:hypothetical protein
LILIVGLFTGVQRSTFRVIAGRWEGDEDDLTWDCPGGRQQEQHSFYFLPCAENLPETGLWRTYTYPNGSCARTPDGVHDECSAVPGSVQ